MSEPYGKEENHQLPRVVVNYNFPADQDLAGGVAGAREQVQAQERGQVRQQTEISKDSENSLRPKLGAADDHQVFAGGGKMGELMRSFDWSANPLGCPETWSPTLQAMTRMLLANCFPMLLWWGPDFLQLYNDAYIPVLGNKHPVAALGRPFRECWSEVFHVLGPLAQKPFEGGPPTWMEDIPLEVNRFGFMEETHFTIGYSAVPDPSAPIGIGGVLATVHETTQKVLGERRLSAIRELSTRSFEARTAQEASEVAISALAQYPLDVPFALIYLIEEDDKMARLICESGVSEFPALRPDIVDLSTEQGGIWRLSSSRQKIAVIENLQKLGGVPAGPWSDPPDIAATVPIQSSKAGQPVGFLVAGISSRLRFDDSYRGFLELLSVQISTGITNAQAYEVERRRAEALAEIDRAKTVFFSNVSHEFRTPLTLMMGPLEDALQEEGDSLVVRREKLELAHRNSRRLLKLVNTLLDFSRIEAGRIQAVYEPINLAEFTTELAGVFRSTIERADLSYRVDCPPLGQPVYVDREMWEKIVLNLLSNAFKFTLDGSIEVQLRSLGQAAELSVKDTGVGIPASDLPHIFDRFYRIAGTRGRSYEGSGIGLALVHEMVKLNGGQIRVESEPDCGSTFSITIPFGSAHLPQDRIGAERTDSSGIEADAYPQETGNWTTHLEMPSALQPTGTSSRRAQIVVADDNDDIREYLRSLLSGAYEVILFKDGEAALEAIIKHPPDLVLTDVMMPKLDGFGLLKEIRSNQLITSVPVIMLSARAGEESRREGATTGADDYLVKPFSARELAARVENQLVLSRLRRESEQRLRDSEERFRTLATATFNSIYRMAPDWSEMRQLSGGGFLADSDEPNEHWLEGYILPEDQPFVLHSIEEAIRAKCMFTLEHRVRRADGSIGWTLSRAIPLLNDRGEITEWLGAAIDVTDRHLHQESLSRLAAIVDFADDAIMRIDLSGTIQTWNQGASQMFGFTPAEAIGRSVQMLVPEDLQIEEEKILARLRAGERIDHYETVRRKKNGEIIEVSITISPIQGESGVTGASKIARDISDRRRIERLLLQSEKLSATGRMAASIAHEINNPLESLINLVYLARLNTPSDSKSQDYLNMAEEELERVSHLARQTLGYYRDTTAPTEVQIHELIRSVLSVYNSRITSAGISVDCRFNDLQKIVASKGEMLQVFSNLIANSIDSMSRGGLLYIGTEPGSNGLEITIRDSGVGIGPEFQEKVFEPFFTTKGERGTGIGLWVSKQLVEARGGHISLRSSIQPPRNGTTVTIFIPFASPAKANG